MARMRFLYNSDIWDAATITAATETGDMVGDNLVNDFLLRVWRPTGLSTERVTFDLGAASEIDYLSILGHNLTSAATVKHQANSINSWGTPPYDQTLTILKDADNVVYPRLSYFPNIGTNYRYHSFEFTDAANPDGYIDIGRIKGGLAYEVTRNPDDKFPVEITDPSEGEDEDGRLGYYREKTAYHTITLHFSLHNETQKKKFEAMFRKVGRRVPFMLALDPDNHPSEYTYFVQLKSSLRTVFDIVDVFSQGHLVFKEVVE